MTGYYGELNRAGKDAYRRDVVEGSQREWNKIVAMRRERGDLAANWQVEFILRRLGWTPSPDDHPDDHPQGYALREMGLTFGEAEEFIRHFRDAPSSVEWSHLYREDSPAEALQKLRGKSGGMRGAKERSKRRTASRSPKMRTPRMR